MGWNLLSGVREITTRYATTLATITQQTLRQQALEEWVREHTYKLAVQPAIQTLNVQRLMLYMKIAEYTNIALMLPPPERAEIISKLEMPLMEEDELFTKRLITQKQLTEQRTVRKEQIRLEKRLQEITERILDPFAIISTDHEAFCLLEKYLWDNLRTETQQILKQLISMCENKAWFIPSIEGLEGLQKLMLQQYVLAFMQYPYSLNALALRLSQMTMTELEGKVGTYYMFGAMQAQDMKQKSLLITAQKQKLITKKVLSQKTHKEWVPTKATAGTSESIDKDDTVNYWEDHQFRVFLTGALRYAYGMPYSIRRIFARQLGLPENAKYAGYFGIGVIPTRRSLWGRKKERYPEAKYLTYSVDKDVMKAIQKYGYRRQSARPYVSRYTWGRAKPRRWNRRVTHRYG